jgi:hypothetical protein
VLAIIERHGFGGSRAVNAALDIAQAMRERRGKLAAELARMQPPHVLHAHDGNCEDGALD